MSVFALSYNDDELNVLAPHLGGYTTASVALPVGLVQAGKITNPKFFAQGLAKTLKQAKPSTINGKHIAIGLPERQALIKLIDLPASLKREELETTLEYQWESVLPIPQDQVYFDFIVVEKKKKAETQKVLVIAYPKEIVDSVIAVCNELKLKPKRVVPISFGLAQFISPKDDSAVLAINGGNGQDLTVMAIKGTSTRFTTVIHTAANNPNSIKQIDNIRNFYEKNVSKGSVKISGLVFVPGPWAPTLAEQSKSLKLPVSIPKTDKFLHSKTFDVTNQGRFIYLAGLIKTRCPMTILPTQMVEELHFQQQYHSLRVLATYLLLSFSIISYASIIFYMSLRLDNTPTLKYSKPFSDYLLAESQKSNDQIKNINAQINQIASVKNDKFSIDQFKTVLAVIQDTPGLTVTEVSIDQEKGVTVIQGSRTNKAALLAFANKIKANPAFANNKVEAGPANWQEDTVTTYSLTISVNGATNAITVVDPPTVISPSPVGAATTPGTSPAATLIPSSTSTTVAPTTGVNP